MNIACIIFTYNRNKHTQKTIEALENNTIRPQKLFIFQDGLKYEKDKNEWEKVNQLIKNVNWCKTQVIVSSENKGLAYSIVNGVNRVFKEYDAVIVLEDDCVAHPLFLQYVTDCLYKYKDCKKVFSINGYSWPANVESNGTDVYFAGRAGSWGWATWKDRWELYEKDYMLLNSIKQNEETNRQFNIWGQDLEGHLKGNIDGNCNSWAVFWSLLCIKHRGFCPTPYRALVHNIGNDGSGVHCGNTELITNTRDWDDLSEIALPDRVEFPANYEKAFSDIFRWISPDIRLKTYNRILYQWNVLLQNEIDLKEYFVEKNIKSIAIWGKGDICRLLLKALNNSIEVVNIVESKPITAKYEGIPIVSHNNISNRVQVVIVIPVYDIDRIENKFNNKQPLIGLNQVLDDMILKYKVS